MDPNLHPIVASTGMTPAAPFDPAGRIILYFVVGLILIAINAFFAASETSLLKVRQSRISQLVQEGDKRARVVDHLQHHPERMLITIQIVVTIVTALASSLATTVISSIIPNVGEVARVAISTLGVAFFLSLFGEITPKNWAVAHSERFALISGRWVKLVSDYIVMPLALLLESLSSFIIRLFGGHKSSNTPFGEDEFRYIVEETEGLEEDEKEMIHNVMEIPSITAREIMTPRTQIVGIERETPIAEAVRLIMEEGHSRLPVYEGSLDRIVGILHAKDLLPALSNPNGPLVAYELMTSNILEIPESKKVDKLLQEFKQKKSQMAVVIDEYGGTSGLVTMEDVLEEIVGPIEDEYDEPEERDIQLLAPGEYLVAGSASLEDVCDQLAFVVNEEDADGTDTIGGLVFSLLGRVPEVGDAVEYHGWRLLVEKVDARRVERLRVVHLEQRRMHEEEAANAAPTG